MVFFIWNPKKKRKIFWIIFVFLRKMKKNFT